VPGAVALVREAGFEVAMLYRSHRPFVRGLSLGLVAFWSATVAFGQDWTQFRGPAGMGVSTEKGLPSTWSAAAGIVWKTELPGPGTSSPVLLGDRIYLTCHTGFNVPGKAAGDMEQLRRHLLCLSRKDGKVLWNTAVQAKLPEQAVIRDNHGYASSTPAADRDRIYCFFGRSGVFAFDHAGKQLWQADVGSKIHGWGSAASPVLVGNLVVVNASVESESLVALDKKTGKEAWRAGGIRESWNTPVVVTAPGGRTELVVAIMGKVLAFDPATGAPLWSCNTDIAWYMVPSLVAHDGVVYCIGGRSGGALAVRAGGRGDVTNTHRLWTGKKGSNVSSPVFHEGHLYWMHEGLGIAYCAEGKTGNIVYEQRIDRAGQIYASPVPADGKIYYLSRNGRAYVVPARPQFEPPAVADLRDRSAFNAAPAVAGGRIYIRSDRFLYGIGNR
jgi:hypothetical protein